MKPSEHHLDAFKFQVGLCVAFTLVWVLVEGVNNLWLTLLYSVAIAQSAVLAYNDYRLYQYWKDEDDLRR